MAKIRNTEIILTVLVSIFGGYFVYRVLTRIFGSNWNPLEILIGLIVCIIGLLVTILQKLDDYLEKTENYEKSEVKKK